MDIRKQKYIVSKAYVAKISVTPSEQEKILFSKYSEPMLEVGGNMTDGTTSYDLTEYEKRIYTDSPFSQTFDTVTLGLTYEQAGVRADIFLSNVTSRMTDLMNTLRNTDSTSNSEFDKIIVI